MRNFINYNQLYFHINIVAPWTVWDHPFPDISHKFSDIHGFDVYIFSIYEHLYCISLSQSNVLKSLMFHSTCIRTCTSMNELFFSEIIITSNLLREVGYSVLFFISPISNFFAKILFKTQYGSTGTQLFDS